MCIAGERTSEVDLSRTSFDYDKFVRVVQAVRTLLWKTNGHVAKKTLLGTEGAACESSHFGWTHIIQEQISGNSMPSLQMLNTNYERWQALQKSFGHMARANKTNEVGGIGVSL